jgi:hypothetical protein
VAGGAGVLDLGEEVGVGVERDRRVGVSELAGDEDDVRALGDQQRGVPVAKRVQRETAASAAQAGLFDGLAEGFADVAVVLEKL